MENEESTVAPETSSTETQSTTTSNDSGVEVSAKSETDTTAPEAPAYVPNYKLKVYDEEKELDDPFLKNLIKDAESEKKVKEIAQKYLGFDTVKSRNEKLKTDFVQYQQTAQPVIQYYNTAAQMLQKKDYDGFFEFLQIPVDDIFKYAVKKAEEAQLPEAQRAEIQRQRQVQKEKDFYASQNQSLQAQQQYQLGQFRTQELNWVLARPDIASVAKAYDDKMKADGKDYSFRQMVIDKGVAHHALTGEDLSAEQATMAVMQVIGGFVTPANMGQTMTNHPQLIKQDGKPPVIPNVSGRGNSPVRKQVSSIEDLKKRRDELASSSN